MDFKPINEWIVVEEESPMTKTAGGIYIPKGASKKQQVRKCKVLAISDDVATLLAEEGSSLQYKVGDLVLHHSQTGIKVDVNDEKDRKFFLKYDAVMGICDEPQEEQLEIPEIIPFRKREE